jgi:CDP-diacylglycerol--glycerol-3-phosphate 3-phosphatidyltransferase
VIKAWLERGLDTKLQQTFPFLFRLPLSPNQLTLAGTAMSVMAALALSQGWFGLAALGVALGGLGDVLDGAVARTKGLETPFGAFLDSTLDRLADMALFLGLIVYYAGQARLGAVWLAGGALVASVLVSYARARAESLLPSFSGGLLERGERILLLEVGAVTQVLFPMGSAMILVLWTILLGSVVTVGQRVQQVRRRLESSRNEDELQ